MNPEEIDDALDLLRAHANDVSKRKFKEIVEQVNDKMNYFGEEPDDYQKFFLTCFSDKEIVKSRTLLNVAVLLMVFGEKIEKDFYDKLFRTFIENYCNYKDDLFCLEMSNFFAYNYHNYNETRNKMVALKKVEESCEGEYAVGASGLYLLDREKERRKESGN